MKTASLLRMSNDRRPFWFLEGKVSNFQREFRLGPFRILYVEDNPDLLESMGELMAADGREIVLCSSGEAALAADAAGRFDLVVTDVSLAGMSGVEMARQLLQADASRWIALCSGFDFSQSVGKLGTNVRCLAKPFEMDEFDALIDEVMAARLHVVV
jgi:two-component system cell cycle response regulator CpdR